MDATRLGHKMSSWSGPQENGKYFSYCQCCDDYVDALPGKVWAKAQVTGPAVVLRCRPVVDSPWKVSTCRHCGQPWKNALCSSPSRMGPCE